MYLKVYFAVSDFAIYIICDKIVGVRFMVSVGIVNNEFIVIISFMGTEFENGSFQEMLGFCLIMECFV